MNKLLIIVAVTALLVTPTLGDLAANKGGVKTVDTSSPPKATACLPGYNQGTDVCAACGAGQTANETGAGTDTSCTAVGHGFYKAASTDITSVTDATLCGNTSTGCPQTACASGKGTATTGETTCTVTCITGAASCQVTAAATIACLPGWKYGGDATTGTCTECTAGQGTSTGTTTTCDVATCPTNAIHCTGAAAGVSACQEGNVVKADKTACVACTPASNCQTCTEAALGTCLTCPDKKRLIASGTGAGTCEACAVVGFEDKCLDCNVDKTQCVKAVYGYAVKADGTLTACTSGGMTSDGTTATCGTQCTDATNCENCQDDQAKCKVCKAGFKLVADACVALAATDKHKTCLTANGTTDADCLTCDAANGFFRKRAKVGTPAADPAANQGSKCECMPGNREPVATETAETTAGKCVPCGAGAATCDDKKALTCTDAAKKAAGKDCVATTEKPDGFFVEGTGDAAQFTACDASCKACSATGATKCTSCGNITPTPAEPAADAVTYNTALKVRWLKQALEADTTGTCETVCPAGFKVEDVATRNNCVADSNTVILSAIALIFSLFLIF